MGIHISAAFPCLASPQSDVMHRVVGEGGTRWIVSLLELEHDLLRNEGLVALNLLAALHQGMYSGKISRVQNLFHQGICILLEIQGERSASYKGCPVLHACLHYMTNKKLS